MSASLAGAPPSRRGLVGWLEEREADVRTVSRGRVAAAMAGPAKRAAGDFAAGAVYSRAFVPAPFLAGREARYDAHTMEIGRRRRTS